MKLPLIVLLLLSLGDITYAGSSDKERAHLKVLDAKCEQAREEKLKPVREEKIEECVEIDNRDRDWCERYFKDYGWGSTTAAGTRNPRYFDQIPECVAAFNAWKNRER